MPTFSFRQKIFITYLTVILICASLIFLFTQNAVKNITQKAMADRALDLIARIKYAENNEALVRQLKESKPLIFFRVSLISNERKILYDSHVKRVLGPQFSQDYIVSHPEVIQAFQTGSGYNEEYSEILSQEFAYFAKSFLFHGKTYVIRIAFPLQYIEELTRDFELGFLASAIGILLLFSLMTWFIINYLTRPIRQIIAAVQPYQKGLTTTVPTIELSSSNRKDEFSQLADTLNSLSVNVRNQIKSLTFERNEKETILESLVEGVIAVNNQNQIVFANTMAEKLLQINLRDICFHSINELPNEHCSSLLQKCQEEGSILTQTIEVTKNGEKVYLDLVAAPKKDKTGALLVIQDKTEHYRIIEMRKDFIANASHELKTPITIIRGFAEALHDNPDLTPEMMSDITSKIIRNSEKMTVLIRDLLALADIEQIAESRLSETNLIDLINKCIEIVKESYPEAEISLEVSDLYDNDKNLKSENSDHLLNKDYTLTIDPNLMELALTNLIENGAKYSDTPAKININLSKLKNALVRIDITDKGFGISKDELDRIFIRFYRTNESRAKKIVGSGLGLSIVENIIAKHFGRIEVKSKKGEGSTFSVFLPS